MKNESKLQRGLIIAMVLCGIAIGALLYLGIQESRDREAMAEQAKIDNQVDVNRIDDSTYHFNLGDGSSCLTIEMSNDTLVIDMVNVMLCHIDNDTITVITIKNKIEHEYTLKYSHYFKGGIPEKSKVKFIHN